jgi:hypothetical protein
MTIEQKIAEILAESRAAQMSYVEQVEDVVAEETDINDPSKGGEQNADNTKNNVGTQKVGGKGSKDENEHTKNAVDAEDSHIAGVTDGVTKVAGDNPDNARNISAMKEDIDALVNGEELSEEFKEKAATIFEAAVLSRVKQEVAALDEAYQVQLAEQVESIKEGLIEKVDGYLDYVVEQWMEQNEIALERGMKSEILEGFVGGLKSLFEEHYIDIPEEKFDVLGSLEEQVEELRSKLDEQFEANVEMKAELTQYQVEQVVNSLAEGLVDTDKEKFFALVEELDFDGVETFAKKAQTIRESYFTNKATKQIVESIVTDSPVMLSEEKYVPQAMQHYVSALNNLK